MNPVVGSVFLMDALAAAKVCPALQFLPESAPPVSLSLQREPVQGRLGSAGEKRRPADDPFLRARGPFPPVGICKFALEAACLSSVKRVGFCVSFRSQESPSRAGRLQSQVFTQSPCSQLPASGSAPDTGGRYCSG